MIDATGGTRKRNICHQQMEKPGSLASIFSIEGSTVTDNKLIIIKRLAQLAPLSSLAKAWFDELASAPAIAIPVNPARQWPTYSNKSGFTAHALQGGLQAFPDQD